MKTGQRNFILVLVLLVAVAVIAYPRLFGPEPEEEFAATENPIQALAAAETDGQKVFLEFFSET